MSRREDARVAGAAAADQVIRAQAGAGMSTERIGRHSADTAAWLFSEARDPDAQAFAAGYDDTAQTLVAELREAEHPELRTGPGSPNPDRALADRGWQVSPHGPGVYVRQARAANIEREAG